MGEYFKDDVLFSWADHQVYANVNLISANSFEGITDLEIEFNKSFIR